ncbi:MAG: RluA family pseudouridine synthase [Erysipelotrichia bacterium]|nr:RluA family pseudouridine synthase [Erysipelotrichia bacterium]
MLKILYEDENLAVIIKPYGLDSQEETTKKLQEQLHCPILPIHRLDKIVSGIIVYGKNALTVDQISKQIQNRQFHKEYLAVVHGLMPAEEDTLNDLLFHDRQKNKTYVVKRARKGVKQATLNYRLLEFKDDKSLLAVLPLTGRTHQIRVQLAHSMHPIVGDGKYGSKENCHCSLFSYHLSFLNPSNKEMMDFKINPPDIYPFNLFNLEVL